MGLFECERVRHGFHEKYLPRPRSKRIRGRRESTDYIDCDDGAADTIELPPRKKASSHANETGVGGVLPEVHAERS